MVQKCPNCGSTERLELLSGPECASCGTLLDGSVSAEVKSSLAENDSNFNVDTVSAGDFDVGQSAFEKAKSAHESRPEINQRRDEQRRARVTTDFDTWNSDKNSFDYPGVDTPTDRPEVQEKDKSFIDDGLFDDLF